MKIQIKNRWNGSVIFECEAISLRVAVELAVRKRVSLSDADLSAANLRAANLRAANLSDADLSAADLSDADLSAANLRAANLRAANLSDADLSDADLSDADLRAANLRDADLRAADLSAADLSDAKKDFLKKLSLAKHEAAGLYRYLIDGKVDGSCYTGECACFVGTLANVKAVSPEKLCEIAGFEMDSSSPVEKWFMAIRKGDTPENNPVSAVTVGWLKEWAKENDVNLPVRKVVWE